MKDSTPILIVVVVVLGLMLWKQYDRRVTLRNLLRQRVGIQELSEKQFQDYVLLLEEYLNSEELLKIIRDSANDAKVTTWEVLQEMIFNDLNPALPK